MKRRDFCKALGLSAACGTLWPQLTARAAAQPVGRAVPDGNYTLPFLSILSNVDVSHDFYYSESFFDHPATEYDHKLALVTLGMVMAAFNSAVSAYRYWVNGEAGRELNLATSYELLGFGDVVYYNYDIDTGKAGAFRRLLAGPQELRLQRPEAHPRGADAAGRRLRRRVDQQPACGRRWWALWLCDSSRAFFEDLQDYLKKAEAAAGTLGTIKLWLGGYSRGAAVANLTAARIRQQLPQIAQENTFVYTFAAPAALTAADRPDLQADYDNDHTADGGLKTDWDVSNIFNIISSGDIVARVMPEEWGYHRNGNDRFLPSTAYQNELDDLSIIESRMGGVPLRFDQLATKEDVDSVIAAALAFCKSAANYHEKYEAALYGYAAVCLYPLGERGSRGRDPGR